MKPATIEVDGKTDNSAAQEHLVSDISSTSASCSSSIRSGVPFEISSPYYVFFCSNLTGLTIFLLNIQNKMRQDRTIGDSDLINENK